MDLNEMHIYIRGACFGFVPLAQSDCTDSICHDEPRVLCPACTENYHGCQHTGLKCRVLMVRNAVKETLHFLK